MNKIKPGRLKINAFHIKDVSFGKKTSIDEYGKLEIENSFISKILKNEPLIDHISVDIIKPYEHDIRVNNIIDFIPISVKVLGKLGEGITNTLTGVYVMLTGERQPDSETVSRFTEGGGVLKDIVSFGRAGTPDKGDHIIVFNVRLNSGNEHVRSGPNAAHRAMDTYIDTVRKYLKDLNGSKCSESHVFFDNENIGKPKIGIILQVPGQGTMFDTRFLPKEPSGFAGSKSIIDYNHMPVVLTPNEFRDGALHTMC